VFHAGQASIAKEVNSKTTIDVMLVTFVHLVLLCQMIRICSVQRVFIVMQGLSNQQNVEVEHSHLQVQKVRMNVQVAILVTSAHKVLQK
jgi:hypothetical protein